MKTAFLFLLTLALCLPPLMEFTICGDPGCIQAAPLQLTIKALNNKGIAVTDIVDGDSIRLMITPAIPLDQPAPVSVGLDSRSEPFLHDTIPAHVRLYETKPFNTLGWYWDENHRRQLLRRILVRTEDSTYQTSVNLRVLPRPAVLVHGFISNASAWNAYLGSKGFLASIGITGFAIGDGQVEGTMNTGAISAPTRSTNTIAENAQILGKYIAGVKRITGAGQVDLIVHSMGGLIARYYVDRVMKERDVAQLIMLGSPHGGSECANLPAALGFYLPASLELRPSYVINIFNDQITRRRGVPFHMVAGTPIQEVFKSPCTDVPSDIVVSLGSASAIETSIVRLPVLHTDLTASQLVFSEFVQPLLQEPPGGFHSQPDAPLQSKMQDLQFTRIFTGHVAPPTKGGAKADTSVEMVVNIEQNVSVASFALYDPTRSLNVSVRGASGKIIQLDSAKNGLRVIEDSSTLVYMGYGFQNPKPGPWRVTILTTPKTPAGGTDFAIIAKLSGGTALSAEISPLLPKEDEELKITGRLQLGGTTIGVEKARAVVRLNDARPDTIPLLLTNGMIDASWKLRDAGLYGIDIMVESTSPDGTPINRASFLAIQVQPEKFRLPVGSISLAVVVFLLFLFLRFMRLRRIRRK
jgi:pimeloyl-ACP methyl ester carboxylesterase